MGTQRELSRRTFLNASLAAAGGAALTGCGGFSTGGGGADAAEGGGTDGLTFTLWGGDAELAAFTAIGEAFTAAEQVPVRIDQVPFGQVLTTVDAGLQSGQAPDLFRVTYTDLGLYADRGALLDIAGSLPAGYAEGFSPALWQAVSRGDAVYGVPHHTDTSMVLFDPAPLAAAGVSNIPTTVDSAWSWEEFLDVARRVQVGLGDGQFAFGVNWQQAGAYRWLSFLTQAGGRLLSRELNAAALDTEAASRTLDYTRSFFTEGLVPPSTSTKGSFVDELFPSRTIAMVFAGDFLLPNLETTVTEFDYQATFLPRDQQAAAELGGNAVVVTADSPRAEAATAFLQFLANEENMARFCGETNVLPTRTALAEQDLGFAVRPELMELFVAQSRAITPELVAQVTVPDFNAINGVLVERLEQAYVGGEPTEAVLEGMRQDIEGILG